MMTAPHMVTGAAIGSMSRRLWLILPIAFVSHFALDFIPHVEASVFFAGRPYWVMALVAVLSASLGIGLVIWACYRKPKWKTMCAGALIGISPDLVDRAFGFDRVSQWPATAWLFHFHHSSMFHHSLPDSEWRIGLPTQIAVLAIALWVARRNG